MSRHTSELSSFASARWFGVSFPYAIKKVLESGFSRARFFCKNKQDFSGEGVVAEMLVNLYQEEDQLIGVEVWQGTDLQDWVFYCHGYMNEKGTIWSHFDGAYITFTDEEKTRLFSENKKIKSGEYHKQFRLDGQIPIKDIYEIASRFFPLDGLVDEYFSMSEL